MDTQSVLQCLFSAVGPGWRVEIRLVPGGSRWVDTGELHKLEMPPAEITTYFRQVVTDANGKPALGAFIWADKDHPPDDWGMGHVLPRPTAFVNSGNGRHCYWKVNRPLAVQETLNLTRLAAIAIGGDKAVCEAARVMRLPGSYNLKDPANPKPCTVEYFNPKLDYDPEELEELLVASAVATVWPTGVRHYFALGLGAVLARAGWELDRALRVARQVCEWTEDEELRDRLTSVRNSFERFKSGQSVSSAELHEALGDDDFKALLAGLGITARDNEILLDGEPIGHVAFIQRDLVNYIVDCGRWAIAEGQPTRWDGQRWSAMSDEAFTAEVFTLLGRLKRIENGEELDFSPNASLASAIAGMARGRLSITPLEPMDADVLPMQNGVLDLRTGELLPSEKEHRNRWVVPYDYDADAACPTWERFLGEALGGDAELVEFMQEWFGYCLLQGNPFQRMLWLYGISGTGKSTILEALQLMLGSEASVSIKADRLDDYVVAETANAKVAVCSEIGQRELRTGVLKSLVAGDAVQARRPYGRPFSVRFTGKVCWSSNSLPPVDEGEGLFRRLIVVECNTRPAKKDVMLWRKLEAERAGILLWSLQGLHRQVARLEAGEDIRVPGSSVTIVDEYQSSIDWASRFVEEEIEADPEAVIAYTDIYKRYVYWARERGLRVEPQGPIFWREMEKKGVKVAKESELVAGRTQKVVRGHRLRPEVFGG